jgi:histidinol-phosphate/aromatic aminotransferase/cobyric acid decarboxylase-like protein
MIDAVIISNRYQFDTNTQLREAIGKLTGHNKDNVLLGAGSSELLGVVTAWTAYKKEILWHQNLLSKCGYLLLEN